MNNIFQQILTALVVFPGNLVYHLILAFSIAGALQAALYLWRDSKFPQGQRMVIGLGILLGIRVIFFISAGLTQQGLASPHAILPIMDRFIATISLIIILWLWIFPEPRRLADAANGLLGLVTLAAASISWVWWYEHNPEMAFNASWVDLGWGIYALALIVIGIIILVMRRPNGWGYGLGMMLIVLVGHGLHLSVPAVESDFPSAVRLAQMAAYPILLILPRRFNAPIKETTLAPIESQPLIQKHPRYGIKPEQFQSILSIATETSLPKLCEIITRVISETMLADICLLVYPPSPSGSGQFTLQCGYDLICEETLGSMALDQTQLPLLTTAMQKSRSLRLPASSTSRDLSSIGKMLDLGSTGHLLAGFVPNLEGDSFLGIILLCPYSDRRWSQEDQTNLENIIQKISPILQRSKQQSHTRNELEKTKQNLKSFQTLLEQTQTENTDFKNRCENLEAKLKKASQETLAKEQIEELDSLHTTHKKNQDTIARLRVENSRLGEMVEKLLLDTESQESSDVEQLREEYRLALQEIALLKEDVSLASQQAQEMEKSSQETAIGTLAKDQAEVFTSVSYDLRQPMASILGYTDLLLKESVGILGASQRKFLERIRASIKRMELLLDDINQITMLDSRNLLLSPEVVNLGDIIDKAVADTSAQLREKSIIMRVDLPDKMPLVQADRDALQQILIHLLENAGAVSPADGEIFLRADINAADGYQEFVLIQVADQGGGISKDDLPRVFSRLYRADNSLIEGIGETGVGLSIVKTLVEAHDGRVWVDTEMGIGSTFNILLPLIDSNPDGNPATQNSEGGDS
ncbi:MAG: ATP-binding protein [Chloroflexota bacterium]|nr:ATP-binding protein [Chloroflexota bacterium]